MKTASSTPQSGHSGNLLSLPVPSRAHNLISLKHAIGPIFHRQPFNLSICVGEHNLHTDALRLDLQCCKQRYLPQSNHADQLQKSIRINQLFMYSMLLNPLCPQVVPLSKYVKKIDLIALLSKIQVN